MLAKLEYSSPPDEVCCWQGRRSGAADRRCGGAFAGLGAAVEHHREDIAGLGAAAESHREDAADQRCGRAADQLGRSGKVARRGAVAKRQAGNAAVAKRLLAGGGAAE